VWRERFCRHKTYESSIFRVGLLVPAFSTWARGTNRVAATSRWWARLDALTFRFSSRATPPQIRSFAVQPNPTVLGRSQMVLGHYGPTRRGVGCARRRRLNRGIWILRETQGYRNSALDVVPDDVLLQWCDHEPQARYPAVARLISTFSKGLLDSLDRRFELTTETRSAPRGSVHWVEYATKSLPHAKFLSIPARFRICETTGCSKEPWGTQSSASCGRSKPKGNTGHLSTGWSNSVNSCWAEFRRFRHTSHPRQR